MKLILGIETSCDDTSLCLLKGDPANLQSDSKLLAYKTFSQDDALAKWGGVVPEIASRNHLQKLTPLLKYIFETANTTPDKLDLIAVTTHPGLLGPLLTGLNAAKTLALINKTPILPINHLYAHLEAIHITDKISYPYLGLLVSGGHSIYFLVTSMSDFQVLGSTLDDAAGEAFDKAGKILGLGYPAGRIIDENAKCGDPNRYQFPIGLKHSKDAKLSFSGLKTSVRQFAEDNEVNKKNINDICASYQKAIVDALVIKAKYAKEKALILTGLKNLPIVVGGGVACNSFLRQEFKAKYDEVYFVKSEFCTDNGTMIANLGLRLFNEAIPYPECLEMDARGRFISKKDAKNI
jgi:N6-L-threonylcarbamoyladenine synthase